MWMTLKDNISTYFGNESDYTYIIPINKNNFFVGKNNSGKSRFLRFIMKNAKQLYLDGESIIDSLCKSISANKKDIIQINSVGISEIDQIIKKYAEYIKMVDRIQASAREVTGSVIGATRYDRHNYENLSDLISYTEPLIVFLGLNNTKDGSQFDSKILPKTLEIKEKIVNNLEREIIDYIRSVEEENLHKLGILYNIFSIDVFKDSEIKTKLYIPTLRGLRNPTKDVKEQCIGEDIYKKRIEQEYNIDTDDIKIITGLDLYLTYKRNLLGSKEKRLKTSKFEKFLSEYFFDGAEISVVPDEENYELKINIDNDDSDRYIYDVGDGISALIIFLYTMYMEASTEKYNLFFIDEPENSFHPGFQRLLMNIISNYKEFEKCICFFSTHSNHLIDIGTREIQNSSVYLCKNVNHKTEICYQDEEFNEVLDELGVQASSVRIANKVIWVEGKYDAFYIRLLLKLHESFNNKKYIEDYDYCFVPYGGSNMKLIDFTSENSEALNEEFITKARKINPKFMVILDNDGMEDDPDGEKNKKYQTLKAELGEDVYRLEVREIENLFPEDVVTQFMEEGIIDKSKLESINAKYDEYKDAKLGKYINGLIVDAYQSNNFKDITGRMEGFEQKGFLYSKSKYYDTVLKWSKKEDFNYERDVPEEAKRLVNIVEKFIEEQ